MAAFDAGAGLDPFIRGIECFFEFSIRNHAFGQVMTNPSDHCATHHDYLPVFVLDTLAFRLPCCASWASDAADATRAASLSEKPLSRQPVGQVQRRRNAGCIGRPVAFDHRPVQPQKHAAIDAAGIDPFAATRAATSRPQEARQCMRQRVLHQAPRSSSLISVAVPSPVFSATLPVKPSVTITSTRVRRQIAAFDKADIFEIAAYRGICRSVHGRPSTRRGPCVLRCRHSAGRRAGVAMSRPLRA